MEPHDELRQLTERAPSPLAGQVGTHQATGEVVKASTYLEFREQFDAFYREHGGV